MTARVRTSQQGGFTTAVIEGEIDLANAASVAQEVLAGVSPDAVGLVIDLTLVPYLDSAGVRALFDVTRRVRDSRRRVRLVLPATSPVRRLVQVSRLDQVAPVFASVEEAFRELRSLESDPAP